jgi:hypothetical protein
MTTRLDKQVDKIIARGIMPNPDGDKMFGPSGYFYKFCLGSSVYIKDVYDSGRFDLVIKLLDAHFYVAETTASRAACDGNLPVLEAVIRCNEWWQDRYPKIWSVRNDYDDTDEEMPPATYPVPVERLDEADDHHQFVESEYFVDPLYWAAKNGHTDCVNYLLGKDCSQSDAYRHVISGDHIVSTA